jgi:hypothetical protein
MIASDIKDIKNIDCFGIFVPLHNKGEGMWLTEDKTISNSELEFAVGIIFVFCNY